MHSEAMEMTQYRVTISCWFMECLVGTLVESTRSAFPDGFFTDNEPNSSGLSKFVLENIYELASTGIGLLLCNEATSDIHRMM